MAATAGNFGPPVVKAESNAGGIKTRVITVLGPAVYSSGGSELDLSTDTTDGMGNYYDGFAVVYSVMEAGSSAAHGYKLTYVNAASGAAATGKIYVTLVEQATPAALTTSSTDLAALTFNLVVMGR